MIINDADRMFVVLYLAANGIRIYTIFRFMKQFFDRDEVNHKLEFGLYILYYCVNSFGFMVFRNLTVNLISNMLLCFLITCLYPGGMVTRLTLAGIICGVSIAWDTLIGAVFFPTNNYFFTTGICSDLCVLITEVIFEKFRLIRHGMTKELEGRGKILFVIPGISILLAVFNYQLVVEDKMITINILGLLVINLAVFWLYDILIQENNEAREARIQKEKIISYSRQYELMQESIQNYRSFRHDIKGHVNALKLMLLDGRIEAAIHYLTAMEEAVENKKEYVFTGNHDVDCILNYKFSKAQEYGISLNYSIIIPKEQLIEPMDFITILMNLLDNAIDAAKECENKYIDFFMDFHANMLMICVENPYTGSIKTTGNKILTGKSDQDNHGFGIYNIRKAAKKYGGGLEISFENGIFSAKVYLFPQ